MLSHSVSLVLFDFCTSSFSRCWTSLIFTFHLTFCHPITPLLTQPFFSPSTHKLLFLRRVAGVCWEKLSRPWEPPQTTGATQKTGLRSAECDKAPETVVYNCSFFTPYWWFVPIRKYVSNSYTFMNMDQCGSFVLSTQWLQSSTSLLGDDILARQMLGF